MLFSLEPLVWVFSCVTFKKSPILSETELLQLFENRNSPRHLQVGAWVRSLLYGSECVQIKPFIMRLSWWQDAWTGECGEAGRVPRLIRSLFGKECVFRFDGEEMGRGCGVACQRQGRLMKPRGCISQTTGAGPDLQPVLACTCHYVLTCLWVKLLRQPQQLGPGNQPCHYVDPFSKFCQFSFMYSLYIYWRLRIF